MTTRLDTIREVRIEKLTKLKKLGINPYPSKISLKGKLVKIREARESLEKQVLVAGRLMGLRGHGKVTFADLKDESGQIQVLFKGDALKNKYELLELLDIGDFIAASGNVTKTQAGELTVDVEHFELLAKSISPLPVNWEGFKDIETRFRKRYVDMVINQEVFERFKRRSKFWQAHREFFETKGFIEINIPVLEHIPGGGDANPFITHMDAIDEDFYLRISQELPLKRLIGGGYEKVYEIGPRFRNEGLSDEHIPEHIAMEFYWAYVDFNDGMKLVKDLFDHVIKSVYGDKKTFNIRGFEVDFSKEWKVIDFGEIFEKNYGVSPYGISLDQVKALLKKNNIKTDFKVNIPRGVDNLWKKIRVTISGPAFVVNHPKYLSPLQKPSLKDPRIVERFQPVIAGSELGNGWSEVNDPLDQYERFAEQQKLRDAGDKEAQWLDEDYIEMLEYGMPPTFGYGHSERVFWFLEDVTAREGVPFPPMKAKK